MKNFTKPLVLVSTLIIALLLLSWNFLDDNAAYSHATAFSGNHLTDADMLAYMADNAEETDRSPAAEDVLVQRIPGDNQHLLLMAFYSKENYSEPFITIENGYIIKLRDDGKEYDKTAGDGLYTAKISVDVKAFRKEVVGMVQQMRANGFKPMRYIHRQMVIDPDAVDNFEAGKFDLNEPISIAGLTNALSSDFSPTSAITTNSNSATARTSLTAKTFKPSTLDSIKKNCLLITNLGVVEDPTRTWNYCTQTGNANGAWTFGKLMRQLASKNPSQIATDAQVSDFVKNWLNNWVVTQVINGDTVKSRTQVNAQILTPWLNKSQSAGAPAGQLDMRFAPFKLTAIINRFDLRSGKKFGIPGHPCGEGRFVFCLVKSDCSGVAEMTVIFEYGINKPNTCESQHDWAQQWVNLKNFPIGSSAYNQALQSITDQFTLCGTNSGNPNQSSLDQIRTNEVALSPKPRLWEFREFVLDKTTGNLKEHTVAQTPADKYSVQQANDDVKRVAVYVNSRSKMITLQKNIMPDSIQGAPFVGAKATVNGNSVGNPPNIYYWDGTGPENQSTFIVDDDARFSFSLATCSGCHAGETQTDFTHIDPAFFGKEAGLSGFLTGRAGSGKAIDFDNDTSNGVMTVKDAALRPSATNPTMRTFNDLDARGRTLKSFVSSTCGSVLSISSQLLFQPTNMVH